MNRNDYGIPIGFWLIWIFSALISLAGAGFVMWLAWLVVNWLIHQRTA